jgi:hypothetical protein
MTAASAAALLRKPHWVWRLFAWLFLTLLLDLVLMMAIAQTDMWLLRTWETRLSSGFMLFVPAGANIALAWALGLVNLRSAGAILATLAILLASLAQVVWALILAFPLDHILNGPH